MHLEALDDPKRRTLVAQANAIGPEYYLAGGTGLALRLGHRTSRDLDWFTPKDIDPDVLERALNGAMPPPTEVGPRETNTARFHYGLLETSFITYRDAPPDISSAVIEGVTFNLATVDHIAVMKAGALLGRAEKRDYVDVHAICAQPDWSLRRFLQNAEMKLSIRPELLWRAVTHFKDAEATIMPAGCPHSWEQVKRELAAEAGPSAF